MTVLTLSQAEACIRAADSECTRKAYKIKGSLEPFILRVFDVP